MSADNGIYVLKTRTEDETDFEYRTIHARAIENLYYNVKEGQHGPNFIPEEAFSYFKECQVFYDKSSALIYAHHLEGQQAILEYGVSILDHGEQVFQEFTDEEMEAYSNQVEEDMVVCQHRRDEAQDAARAAAIIRLMPSDTFHPTHIIGFVTTPDGERVHGQLTGEGVEEIKVGALHGDGADFLPNSWCRSSVS